MKLLKSLYRIKVLTPMGLWYFLLGLYHEGKTLNALLYYAARMFATQTALVQDERQISYPQLYQQVRQLATNLAIVHRIQQGNTVALIAKNSILTSITLFALSRTGVHLHLLNPEMSKKQFLSLLQQYQYDMVIYGNTQIAKKLGKKANPRALIMEGQEPRDIGYLINHPNPSKISRRKAGNLVVLTGGTSGKLKSAARKQSILDFLHPLTALVDQLQLHTYHSVYIPTPMYHGYGLSAVVVSTLLGSTIHFTEGFQAKKACTLIQQHQIEVVTLVPTMLSKMLSEQAPNLSSLKVIISGGAPLHSGLILETHQRLGELLYNLYGTTEAGFCILGTPMQLKIYPEALGKAIQGVRIRVTGSSALGELEVKSRWSIKTGTSRWIKTGDLVHINQEKFIFLKGRIDDMIVSGGENVYPKELEDVLSTHPQVELVAVIGIADQEFGQRLKAFVTCKSAQKLTEQALHDWLKDKVARYQMPVAIAIVKKLPLSDIGKVKKSHLHHPLFEK